MNVGWLAKLALKLRVVSEEVLSGTEIQPVAIHCHHHNGSCINMGSDESHFNVSLIVRVKVTWQCPQTTISEERGESKRNRTEVLPHTSLTPYRWAKPAHTCVKI